MKQITLNVPDEATNGDVFQAMFPNSKVITGFDIMHIVLKETLEALPVSKDFWNAKYDKGEKNVKQRRV